MGPDTEGGGRGTGYGVGAGWDGRMGRSSVAQWLVGWLVECRICKAGISCFVNVNDARSVVLVRAVIRGRLGVPVNRWSASEMGRGCNRRLDSYLTFPTPFKP